MGCRRKKFTEIYEMNDLFPRIIGSCGRREKYETLANAEKKIKNQKYNQKEKDKIDLRVETLGFRSKMMSSSI
jgi:hypothetical protein